MIVDIDYLIPGPKAAVATINMDFTLNVLHLCTYCLHLILDPCTNLLLITFAYPPSLHGLQLLDHAAVTIQACCDVGR